MKYSHYIIKRQLEDVLLSPFILIGRLIALLSPLKKEYETFFFFPFYHTGGAEKVHALVTQAVGNPNCIIYFTRKSVDQNFYNDFVASGCTIKDISKYTDNKLLYFVNFIYRGIISGYINRQQQPVVFNGQSNFGYKLSRWIKTGVPQVELIHSFNTFSWIRLPFLPFIAQTIMISKQRIEDHLQQYRKINVPATYDDKIRFIVNGIPLPATITPKDFTGKTRVLYVGRGTEEKRVHLIAQMAKASAERKLDVQFVFMGDVKEAIPAELLPFCSLIGQKSDPKEIDEVYQQAHIVIITSYTEGFPMVIEEGMARGCAVIATPVGDIPYHVKQDENGFLFTSSTDEGLIVNEAIRYLSLIVENKQLLVAISERNIQYATNNFSIETFNSQYQQIFNQLRRP